MTIDWKASAVTVHNLVRGLSPYPAARATLDNGDCVKIYQTALTDRTPVEPGRITIHKNRMFADTADGVVEILSLQPAGKKRMDTDAWLRGVKTPPQKFI